jgi:hypothetical protein
VAWSANGGCCEGQGQRERWGATRERARGEPKETWAGRLEAAYLAERGARARLRHKVVAPVAQAARVWRRVVNHLHPEHLGDRAQLRLHHSDLAPAALVQRMPAARAVPAGRAVERVAPLARERSLWDRRGRGGDRRLLLAPQHCGGDAHPSRDSVVIGVVVVALARIMRLALAVEALSARALALGARGLGHTSRAHLGLPSGGLCPARAEEAAHGAPSALSRGGRPGR